MKRLALAAAALLSIGSLAVDNSIVRRHDRHAVHEKGDVQWVADAEPAGRSLFTLSRSKDGDAQPTPSAEVSATKGNQTSGGDREPVILKADQSIYRLAWEPGGKMIAVVGVGYDTKTKGIKSTLRFWDVEKREVRRSVDVECMTKLESISFSPNGQMLAVAATRHSGKIVDTVRLIDPETGATQKTIPLRGTVRSVVYSPDGKTLAIGGQDIPANVLTGPFVRTVQFWDVEKERSTREFRQELRIVNLTKSGNFDGLRDMQFSPDGKLLAVADVDFSVRLIDLQTGRVQQRLQGHSELVLAIAFCPDGKALASAAFDRTVRIWDTQTGNAIRTLEGNNGQVWRVVFSADGRLLVTGGTKIENGKRKGEVIVWDTRTWQPIRDLPVKGVLETPAISPNNKILAVGAGTDQSAGVIQLWQLGDLLRERR
jgi:WD40 repeat protein